MQTAFFMSLVQELRQDVLCKAFILLQLCTCAQLSHIFCIMPALCPLPNGLGRLQGHECQQRHGAYAGIVVGEAARVGDHVTIMQHVTLGGTGNERGDRHPKIGNHVQIGVKATILG